MFVVIATYHVKAGEEDAIVAFHEQLERQPALPSSEQFFCELLRSRTAPRVFITLLRATSKQVVQAVLDDLEHEGWYSRFLSLVEGQIRWREYTEVRPLQETRAT